MSTQADPYIVILAGGHGTRFWPVSRLRKPKQFLALEHQVRSPGNGESLIQATVRRVRSIASPDHFIVVTNELLRDLVRQHVSHAEIIAEPMGRNTAASIGLAALHVRKKNPQGVMVILPADHAVKDEKGLCATLREAVSLATSQSVLVTIGIKPSFPHTGYGYVKRGKSIAATAYEVIRFFEKPNLERATRYCESGDFYWNSGMFAWRAQTLLDALKEHMPSLYQGLMLIESSLGSPQEEKVTTEVFQGMESLSIDFGVLEHARNCAVVEAQPFGWNDVGSWDAWADQFKADEHGNVIDGQALALECKDCIVHTQDGNTTRFTALLGVENVVIIDSGDAILVCARDRVQEVKKIVAALEKKGRKDLI